VEFTITPDSTGTTQKIAFIGKINEDSEMVFKTIISSLPPSQKIIFNFSQVTSINSLGVRSWITFLRSLNDTLEIIFQECTPDVIMQINMIPSFLGKGTVESFYVNYICDTCDKETRELIKTADLKPKTFPNPPRCTNENCDIQTEELANEYFAFLMR